MLRRVLVVDDHVAVRNGVAQMLRELFEGIHVGTADSAHAALDSLADSNWDLVILDLSLPGRGGLDIIRQMKDTSPQSAILVYTMFPEEQFGVRALRAGADGYLTKDRPESELIDAARRIASGKRYITPALADSLANYISDPSAGHLHELLSDREFQILRMLAAGKTPTDAANELSLSIKTVSTYRTRILTKLNLTTTAELIRYAIEQGLVT
jgi:two-component system invasion response regulator UvrY